MEQNTVHINLECLEKLQKDLGVMANILQWIYEKSNESLDKVHEQWKDVQYQKFYDEFIKTREKILESSEEMAFFADDFIQKRIELTKKIMNINL